MPEELNIKPLRCRHCGEELPVMGQLVTFRCPSCLNYWVLAEEGLEPIFVYRAVPEDAEGAPGAGDELLLPFWTLEVDGADVRRQIDTAAPGLAGLVGWIEAGDSLNIYVPAFRSPNTYAYLKVGRLLTRLQPSFRLVRSEGDGRPILCALRADEAVALVDFIFFATLPESIQRTGEALEKVRLRPARPPRLIEFPFKARGASLVSVIGGFWISGRLVEAAASLVE